MAKILIVDDSRTSRRILTHILQEHGHEIAGEAHNGQEAVALYQTCFPDIVTMDITMPVMDGIAALQEIKKIDKAARVIMITAAGQKEKVSDALKLGAAEFVTKPFVEEEVLKAMEGLENR